MLDYTTRVDLAVHQAKKCIAEDKRGNMPDADKAYAKMIDLFADSDYPNLIMADTIVRLGRHNALDVGFDKDTIQNALALRVSKSSS